MREEKSRQKNQELSQQHQRDLENKRLEHEHEIRRQELENNKSEVAHMVNASPEIAAQIAEIEKLKIKKEMSSEQLEKIAMENSDGAANAISEQNKAMQAQAANTSSMQIQLYERMLLELKESTSSNQVQLMELVSKLERSGTTGQELLRDVGVSSGANNESAGVSIGADSLDKLTRKLGKLITQLKNQKSV